MHNFKKLEVWNASIEFSADVHKITKKFPKHELWGITSQMRRAVVSIPSNISEGCGRTGNKEFVHFLSIANGSSYELYSQIEISFKIGYIEETVKDDLLAKLSSIQKMIYNLIKKFNT